MIFAFNNPIIAGMVSLLRVSGLILKERGYSELEKIPD